MFSRQNIKIALPTERIGVRQSISILLLVMDRLEVCSTRFVELRYRWDTLDVRALQSLSAYFSTLQLYQYVESE